MFEAYDDTCPMSQKGTAKAVGLSLEDLEKAISAEVPGSLPGPALVSHLVKSSAAHQHRRPHSPRCVSLTLVLQVKAYEYDKQTGDIYVVCGN